MKLSADVDSGAAYLISLASIIILGLFLKAPFTEFFMGVASLYGWHTGRRLIKQIKVGSTEMTCNGTENGDTNGKK